MTLFERLIEFVMKRAYFENGLRWDENIYCAGCREVQPTTSERKHKPGCLIAEIERDAAWHVEERKLADAVVQRAYHWATSEEHRHALRQAVRAHYAFMDGKEGDK